MIVVLWWFEFCHLGNCIALAVFRLRLFSVCFDIVRDSISIVIRAFSSLIVLFASGNEGSIEMICAGAHCEQLPVIEPISWPPFRISAPERDTALWERKGDQTDIRLKLIVSNSGAL